MGQKGKYQLNEEGKRIYKCSFCEKSYPYRASLIRHIEKYHKNATENGQIESEKINEKNSVIENREEGKKVESSQVLREPNTIPQNITLQDLHSTILSLKDELAKANEQNRFFIDIIMKQKLLNYSAFAISPEKSNSDTKGISSAVSTEKLIRHEANTFKNVFSTPEKLSGKNLTKSALFESVIEQVPTPYELVTKERHIYIPKLEKIVKCANLKVQIIAFLAEHGEKLNTVKRYYRALKKFSMSLTENKTPDYEDWLAYVETHKKEYIERTPEIRRNQETFETDLKIVSTFLKKLFGFAKLSWPSPFPPRKHPFIPDPVLTREFLLKVEKASPLLFVALYIMYLTGIRPIALLNLKWNQITMGTTGPIIKINYTGKYDKGSFTKPIPESAFESFMKIKRDFNFQDEAKIWPKSKTQLNLEMRSFTLKSNTVAIKCSSMRKAHANTIMQSGIAEVCRDALKHQNAATTMSSYIPDDWRKLFTLNIGPNQKSTGIIENPITANDLRKLRDKEREIRYDSYENSLELERRTYEFLKNKEQGSNNIEKYSHIKRIKRRHTETSKTFTKAHANSHFHSHKRRILPYYQSISN